MAKTTYGTWANWTRETETSVRAGQQVTTRPPLNFRALLRKTWLSLQREARRPTAYLVPLRWFIGIGWLRASAEKLVDPTWHNGEAIRAFVENAARPGAFPEFETFLHSIVEPAAPVIAWVVVALQLYCGAGILLGRSTNAALLTGIGMNLTFMLAGVPNPSAFYVLIQLILFSAGAGAIMGFDGRATAPNRSLLIAARADNTASRPNDRWWLGGLASVLLAVSAYSFGHGRDFSPAGSINDPALVLGTVAALGGLIFFIRALRLPTEFELDFASQLHPSGELHLSGELNRANELDLSVELDLSGRPAHRASTHR
ncbi:MAG TPA: hypothetical protein VM848_18805 [Acidimicrobiia bacterium]|nr:hypothetical protein [Acidimicrobiia bacterium]